MKKAIAGLLACALALAFAACALTGAGLRPGLGWESCAIVRLEGPGLVAANLSLGYMRWATSPADGSSGAILVRDGDLLYVILQGKDAEKKVEFIVPWKPEDGAHLAFRLDGPRLLLGERAVALSLGKNAAGWDWLHKASEKDLASLRFIFVTQPLSDEQVRVFARIAGANPRVGLALTEDADGALLTRLPALDPRWLMMGKEKIAQADLDALTKRKAIESLILNVEGMDLNLQGLAALPNLRQLTLSGYESAKIAIPDLPRLESLTLAGGAVQDLSPFKRLTGLKELDFTLGKLTSLKGIEALPQLQELGLYNGAEKDKPPLDCAPLGPLKRLRWMAFGPDISPEQFTRILQTHPNLEVVEVLECEGITSLAPLAALRDLKALVLFPEDNKASLAPLKQMKQLDLLVLSEWRFEKDAAAVADLRARLPDCVIAEGDPFCLGAGRILLLVPIVAFGWMVIVRRRSRAPCRAPCPVRS